MLNRRRASSWSLVMVGLLSLLLGACAQTNYPLLIPPGVVNDADTLGQKVVMAVAQRDTDRLIALGLSEPMAKSTLAEAPPNLTGAASPHFLFDGLVGYVYFRQYTLASASQLPRWEIRVWFSQIGERVVVDNVQYLENKGQP